MSDLKESAKWQRANQELIKSSRRTRVELTQANESIEKLNQNAEHDREELATAKAENGRLAKVAKAKHEALTRAFLKANNQVAGCCGWNSLCEDHKAISLEIPTSNALDYWQGEIRKARAEEAWFISSEAENTNKESGMVRCHCDGKGTCPESKFITWLIERAHDLDVKSHQSNQSKGESGEGEYG